MLLYLLQFCKILPACALPAWQRAGADERRIRPPSLPHGLSPLASLTTRTPSLLAGFPAPASVASLASSLPRWWVAGCISIVNRRTYRDRALSQVLPRPAVCMSFPLVVSPLHLSRATSIPDPFPLTPYTPWLLQPIASRVYGGITEASYA